MDNKFIDILLSHQSIRKYTDRKVTKEERDTIVKCAQMAPTSNHFQAYSIIEIISPEERRILSEIAGGQRWVNEAPLVLLFCADLHRGSTYYPGTDKEEFGSTENFIVSTVDAALAAEKAFIAAQALGMGGVCVGGIRNDVAKVRETVKLPELVYPLFLLCLGFPAEQPGLKPRLPMEALCKIDTYDESKDRELIAQYDAEVSAYYDKRSGGEIKDTWTGRAGNAIMGNPRHKVADDIRAAGFLKR